MHNQFRHQSVLWVACADHQQNQRAIKVKLRSKKFSRDALFFINQTRQGNFMVLIITATINYLGLRQRERNLYFSTVIVQLAQLHRSCAGSSFVKSFAGRNERGSFAYSCQSGKRNWCIRPISSYFTSSGRLSQWFRSELSEIQNPETFGLGAEQRGLGKSRSYFWFEEQYLTCSGIVDLSLGCVSLMYLTICVLILRSILRILRFLIWPCSRACVTAIRASSSAYLYITDFSRNMRSR